MGVKVREKVQGSKVWWVFINHQGRRKSLKVGSKDAAVEVADKIAARLTLGEAISEKKRVPTIAEYYQDYWNDYVQTGTKLTTQSIYNTAFHCHILPKLGKIALDELKRSQIKRFISQLVGKGLAKSTIRVTLCYFSALLNQAIEDGLIQVNPAARTGKFYRHARIVRDEVEPLEREEVLTFLDAVERYSPDYYALFLAALHTGLRSSELAGLQWGDIDVRGKFVTVRRNLVLGQITSTKNDRVRRVDLSDALLTELKSHKKRLQTEWLKQGRQLPEWVFANQRGDPANMHNIVKRHFHKCLEKAGLRRIRFHDLRHTFASLLIQDNQSLAYVKDQLGHSSIKITVDVYGHLVPGANREAVNRLPSRSAPYPHPGEGEALLKTANSR